MTTSEQTAPPDEPTAPPTDPTPQPADATAHAAEATARPAEPTPEGFAALGLDPELCAAVAELGYEEPTAIQRAAIPAINAGRDLLGQAATGTGKTAAFALPLLQRLRGARGEGNAVRGLIVVPTRELAMQVAQAVHAYGKSSNIRVLPIYGGQSMKLQLRALERGVDVIVATPGRAIDHIGRGTLKLGAVECVVLDEADEMLDMGFAEDLEAIFAALPATRQTALFSATLPKKILAIAATHLNDPVRATIVDPSVPAGEKARVREVAYAVPRAHKITALSRVLDMENPTAVIVFCRTRGEVDDVTATFGAHGYEADALHGGLSQEMRDRVLAKFREAKTDILVATDVAARGLDIDHVSHVVNFEVPSSPEVYTHRIGRTGRAGREGVAITFFDPREMRLLRNIEQQTKRKIGIESLPTVHELQERRMERVREAVVEAIAEGGNERFARAVTAMSDEFEPTEVAAAALKLLEATLQGIGDADAELPTGNVRDDARGGKLVRPRADVGVADSEMTKLFVNAGRKAGIRAGDLVGLIANMAKISSKQIGTITLSDNYALVEVPANLAETVLKAMHRATVRGVNVRMRRDRET